MKPLSNPFSNLFITLLFFSMSLHAQNQQPQRNTNTLLTSSTTTNSTQFKIPEPIGFVNDFESLFTAPELKTLDSLIKDFHDKTSSQLAIITCNAKMIDKDEFDDFTYETFKSWGLEEKGGWNGILIGISKDLRKIRIETGSGPEKILTDIDAKNIIEKDFLPLFKEAKYYNGTLNGLSAIMAKLK